MKKEAKIHIGTSGWHYKHWLGPFYPKDLKKENMLEFYTQFFKTAEINNSFYKLPGEKTLKNWKSSVEDDFIFSFKANRYTTHMKKLKDPEKSMPKLTKNLNALRENLGPVLFQLPPKFGFNRTRLSNFLKALPEEYRYTFEFRDKSWLNDKCYKLLKENGAALCIYDYNGELSPVKFTANFAYFRFHGPDGPYRGNYSDVDLQEWAEKFKKWSREGLEIFCYFDNDDSGYAPNNALTLKKMLED